VSPRGLSPNQLREELAEHGSREAVVKAHPALADWFRASEEAGRRLSETYRAIQDAMAPTFELAEPLDEVVIADSSLPLQREMVDELAALRRQLVTAAVRHIDADDADIDPRSHPDPYDTDVFWKAVAMLIEDVELTTIAAATKLSYRKVTKIRDWKAHPGRLGPDGSPGYRLYPGDFPGTLLLRKLRKPL
jgi:hypothetical protein